MNIYYVVNKYYKTVQGDIEPSFDVKEVEHRLLSQKATSEELRQIGYEARSYFSTTVRDGILERLRKKFEIVKVEI